MPKTSGPTRALIRATDESTQSLARRLGLNRKTVAKWKKRQSTEDRPPGAVKGRIRALSPDQEALILKRARANRRPLDVLLADLREELPLLTRSSLYRCLRRNGLAGRPAEAVEQAAIPASPASPRTRRKEEETRRAIVDAAAQLFLRYGYERTSMSAVWTVVGGSKSTLWRHFPSKDALLSTVLETIMHEFENELPDILSADRPLQDTLELYCRKYMSALYSLLPLQIYRLIVGSAGRFHDMGNEQMRVLVASGDQSLIDFIERRNRIGEVCCDDAETAARLLLSLCEGTNFHRALFEIETFDDARIAIEAQRAAQAFMVLYAAPPTKT